MATSKSRNPKRYFSLFATICCLVLSLLGLVKVNGQCTPTITTIAGNGTAGYTGNGGSAISAELNSPYGICTSTDGSIYFADLNNNVVRKITPAGIVSTIAGNGTAAYTGDGGAATAASLSSPFGVAIDAAGIIYIADKGNNVIRKVNTSGTISTIAGNGTAGYTGDGGPATAAELHAPIKVVPDGSGNLFIVDAFNCCIRKINTGGAITTIAGTGTSGRSGDGGPATAAQLSYPFGMAFDASGNIYIADYGNGIIRKVDASGTTTTIAGNGFAGVSESGMPATASMLTAPRDVAVDTNGNIFISASNIIYTVNSYGVMHIYAGTGTSGFTGDGGPATAALLAASAGITMKAGGTLLFCDYNNNRIRSLTYCNDNYDMAPVFINGNSQSMLVTENTGPIDFTRLMHISDEDAGQTETWSQKTAPAHGNLLITGVVTAPSGSSNIIAGTFTYQPTPGFYGNDIFLIQVTDGIDTTILTMNVTIMAPCTPNITTIAGNGTAGYAGDGGPATAAEINTTERAIMDKYGNIYIADALNSVVRKIAPNGIISTYAGNGIYGMPTINGPATASSFGYISGIAFDYNGTFYILDNYYEQVYKVDTSGLLTLFAGSGTSGFSGDGGYAHSAELHDPFDITFSPDGTAYIADGLNYRIRKVSPSGIISTFAGNGTQGSTGDGGPATAAEIVGYAVALDSNGNLYISDFTSVRKVTPSGVISTFAGTGVSGTSGNGGPATAAQFMSVQGIVTDPEGNIYISDIYANNIRVVNTLGVISDYAGSATGTAGYSGDGGAATSASLDYPVKLSFDNSGNLLVPDALNYRIRKIGCPNTPPLYVLSSPQALSVAENSSPTSIISLLRNCAKISHTNNFKCYLLYSSTRHENHLY